MRTPHALTPAASIAAMAGLLAVAGTASAGAVATPSPAAPQGPWGAVANVSSSGSPSDDPRLAAGPTGTVTYVWEGWDGASWQIRGRNRGPAGGFTAPFTLSRAGVDHEDPRIAIGADGLTAVAWKNMARWNRTLQVRVKAPGAARFGTTRTISDPSSDATQDRVAVLPDGSVLVVWAQGRPGRRTIQARVLPRGAKRFRPTVNVSSAYVVESTAEGDPSIAVSGDGSATVAWEAPRRDGSFIVQTRTRTASGGWGRVRDLSLPGAQSNDVVVAASVAGEVTAVWERAIDSPEGSTRPSRHLIQARVRPAGSTTWGPITNLSRWGTQASDPSVAVAPDGTVTTVWEWASDAGAAQKVTQSRTRVAGSAWGPLQVLSARGYDVDDPEVVVASDGTATAVWKRSWGSSGVRVQARTRPAGATEWNAPVWLSGTRGEADEPRLTVAPDGVVSAVWKLSSPRRVVPDQDFFLQTAFTAPPR